MLLIASNRKLDIKEVLQVPLGPLPLALANGDGTLKKTNMSGLARKLETKASPAETISQPSVCSVRGSDEGLHFTNIAAGHRIQQWRRLLACGESKMKLIEFIANQ